MTYLRRIILAAALISGLVPAVAQVPPPVPALPDVERRTSYSITGTTCSCAVNFALYGDSTDYQNWVEVYLNNTLVNFNDPTFGWTITSPTGSLSTHARPITDAVLTFNNNQTGTVQIVGARRPRRLSQFTEGRGVAARDLNQSVTDITATLREMWDKTNDVTGRALLSQPGNTLGLLPLPSACAGKLLSFDVTGLIPQCSSPLPIVANTITNTLLAQMPANTVKCNPTGSLANAQDCTTLPAASFGALTGDVTNTAGSYATTISANAVTNAKMAPMPANTVKCNPTGSTANAQDCTSVSLAVGGLGGSQSAATANQIPVYPGSGGAAAPTTIGGAGGLFDTICSSTIGREWVRLSGGWGCTSLGFANPVWWGADPTGASDSSSAITSAEAASNNIFFPGGTFKSSTGIFIALSGTAAHAEVWGVGPGSTVLNFTAAVNGIAIAYNSHTQSSSVHDLTLTTTSVNAANGVLITQTDLGNFPSSTDLYNLDIWGADNFGANTEYWFSGVRIDSVSNVNYDRLNIQANNNGAGIELSASALCSCEHQISNSNLEKLGNGIVYDNNVQGVAVVNTNFGFASNAIVVPASQTGLSGLSVVNSQFGPTNTGTAISLNSPIGNVLISNNLFFIPNAVVSGISMSNDFEYQIVGNQFIGAGSNSNGIILGTTGVTGGIIAGNLFDGTFSSGIATTVSTKNSLIIGNYFGGTYTSKINPCVTCNVSNNFGFATTQTAPTVTASPFTFTNGNAPSSINVLGGTVSSVTINGGPVVCNASPCALSVFPHDTVTITYSSVPSLIVTTHQ